VVDLDWYAKRIVNAQDVRMGSLRRETPSPVNRLDVAATLHAMADHTMLPGGGSCGALRQRSSDISIVSATRWNHRPSDEAELPAGSRGSPGGHSSLLLTISRISRSATSAQPRRFP
jgi:hypothetical protein